MELKFSQGKFNTLYVAPLNVPRSIQLMWGYHFRVPAEQYVQVIIMRNNNFCYSYYFYYYY